jgi:hypothetical protein
MLNAIMLSFIILSVVLQSVLAPMEALPFIFFLSLPSLVFLKSFSPSFNEKKNLTKILSLNFNNNAITGNLTINDRQAFLMRCLCAFTVR